MIIQSGGDTVKYENSAGQHQLSDREPENKKDDLLTPDSYKQEAQLY